MIFRFLKESSVQSFASSFVKYVGKGTYDKTTNTIEIPYSYTDGVFCFPIEKYEDVSELKYNLYNKLLSEGYSDILKRADIDNWYSQLPQKFRYSSIPCDYTIRQLLNTTEYLDFLRNICVIFDTTISANKNDLIFSLPYLEDKIKIRIDDFSSLKNFKKDIVSELVQQCVYQNSVKSNSYDSCFRLKDSLIQLAQEDLPSQLKEFIAEKIKSIPYTKDDFIRLYQTFERIGNQKILETNIELFSKSLEDLKNSRKMKRFSVDDQMEIGRLLLSLDKMKGDESLSQQQIDDYEKVKSIARINGCECMEKSDLFVGSNITLGKYFYLQENAIVPGMDVFDYYPVEFFKAVKRIEEQTEGLSEDYETPEDDFFSALDSF